MKNETMEAIMKWQVMVLLCCAWMSGVALGDTENSQKVEQGGTAAANTGSGNMTVYNNHYGISEEAFAKKAVDLGVTDAALTSFFKILKQEKVAPADLDKKLREITGSYKKLLEGSDDPEVNTLLRQARESIEGKDAQGNSVTIDFAKAEVLLQQAMLREQQHIRELQQIEKQARIEIEIEYKSSAESQSMKWILPQLGELVDTQFYELLQIEEQAKAAWENKQVSVALILVQLGDLADTQLKYDEANSYYQLASDRLKTRSWEISSTMSYQSISMPKSFSYPRSLSPVPSAPKSFSYPSSSSHAPMNPCYQNQTPGVCDPVSGCGCTQK